MAEATEQIDRLKLLTIGEVCRRTGMSRTKIFELLARDTANKTPGHHFAAPVRFPGQSRSLHWRELTIVRWMEMQEAKV